MLRKNTFQPQIRYYIILRLALAEFMIQVILLEVPARDSIKYSIKPSARGMERSVEEPAT